MTGRSSAKVHPAPTPAEGSPPAAQPAQPTAKNDPEMGNIEDQGEEQEEPEWAQKWLSTHNKREKLHAFAQYIQRVQDLGEGPVNDPTPEQRHATSYWLTRRFFLDRCSAHGVPHIVRHDGLCRKLGWMLMVLLALGGLGYQVHGTLTEFLGYPKKVTIEVLEETEPTFPAITICNFNILSVDKMKTLEKYREIADIEREITSQRLDCAAYQDEFNGFYSTEDDYDLVGEDYWDYAENHEYEYESPDGEDSEEGEHTSQAPDEADGAAESAEPTFYEVSTQPGVGKKEGADSTESIGATGQTADDVTEAVTEAAGGSVRRRRQVRTTGPPRGGRSTSPRPSGGSGGAARPPGSTGRARLTGRRLQSAPPEHRPRTAARRRREAPGRAQNYGGDMMQPWMFKNGIEGVDDGNGSMTFFDPTCRCEMTCDAYGCYQSDSVFDDLGDNKSFRKLLEKLKTNDGDLKMLRRAFTPSADEMKQYGIKSSQFITSCSLDNTKCTHEDFHRWQSDGYGNCFTFNSGFRYKKVGRKWMHQTPNKTRSYGSQSGLRVTLNVDPKRYASLLTPDVGVRVLIHPPDQLPFPEEKGFSVLPGLTTIVGMRRKRIDRVGPPHGTCRSTAEWGDKTKYTPTACRKRCQEADIRETCNCADSVNKALTLGLPSDLPPCNPLTSLEDDRCRQRVKSKYAHGVSTCDCPPACVEDRYDQTVSMNLPNKIYYKIIRNITDGYAGGDICDTSEISNNTIRLQLFLEDLSYESIHESAAYSLEALISNIGGLMGLFVGISALTLVEFIEYAMELVTNGCRNCCSSSASKRSGIRRVEVLPPDQQTGMQYIRVVHKFEVPQETEVRDWPQPTLVDRQMSTMVTVPVNGPDNKAWMKVK
ncbi:degenerin unc-8-like [Pollicipes pollicipes]|uniref:degenerin unc-8-like n=1 Tax=Pollicipes pollicipes TaxID=41117 RepID=UPI001884D2B7|nr:degenerin unc-8-like [Pollicipes pollicipes]